MRLTSALTTAKKQIYFLPKVSKRASTYIQSEFSAHVEAVQTKCSTPVVYCGPAGLGRGAVKCFKFYYVPSRVQN